MARYLLDTNHLGQAIDTASPVFQRMLEVVPSGDRFGTCIPVLCEIEAGVQQLQRPAAYRRALSRLLEKRVRIWPVDVATARLYGEIYQSLRSRGRKLSQVDIMLAALARQMDLTLLTSDRDFEALPDIPSENWTEQTRS